MQFIVITVAIFAFTIWREICFSRERRDYLDKLTRREQDFLDRLMAKDLPEVKREQAPQRDPVAITRRQNDARIAEQARKVEG